MSCLTPEEFDTIRRHPLLRTTHEFREIVRAVSAEFGVKPSVISSPGRGSARIAEARGMVCLIAHQRGFNTCKIARLINRDRSTVRKAVAKARVAK